jgi:hypothetical protein
MSIVKARAVGPPIQCGYYRGKAVTKKEGSTVMADQTAIDLNLKGYMR